MADVGIKISATDATKLAFDSVTRGLGTIQSSAASVAGSLAGLGIGISVGAFVAMTKSIVDGLDAMNDLNEKASAMGQAMYAAAQAQQGSGDDQAYTSEDAPQGESAGAGDDDVVDAEIVDDEDERK